MEVAYCEPRYEVPKKISFSWNIVYWKFILGMNLYYIVAGLNNAL